MRYVVAVAEERNFTRAAERCFVVQSALSHQVKALEQELGAALFVRSSRRVELTPAGEAFLVEARTVLAAADRAACAAVAALGEVRGSLSIGVIPTVTAVDVAEVVARFHTAHPGVELSLRTGGSDDFLRDLAAGRLDVAFLGLGVATRPSGVASRELGRGRLVAVVPSGHALSTAPTVSLADLAGEPFVDFPAGSPGRLQGDVAFSAAGLRRRVALEVMSVDFMLSLVARGLGVCLLPPGVVRGVAGVHLAPVVDGPVRVEHLAWDGFNPSPAALAFVEGIAPVMQ